MFRSKKFIFAVVAVAVGLGFLLYSSLQSSSVYYYTVTEYRSQQALLDGKAVRVVGQVAKDSVEADAAVRFLKFTITEGSQSLLVVYRGVVPDTFAPDVEVVVQGQMKAGVFQAESILTKCPSKYEPKPQ